MTMALALLWSPVVIRVLEAVCQQGLNEELGRHTREHVERTRKARDL